MAIVNVHERVLAASAAEVGKLLDSLASSNDRLWPTQSWPAMRFDGPLAKGAIGGHGPIRYTIEEYFPGQVIWFRFTAPKGFVGLHGFEVVPQGDNATLLRHSLNMSTQWPATFTWPIMYRPMHDALIEDALTQAEASLGLPVNVKLWSKRVMRLRWLVSGGKARQQWIPPTAPLESTSP
jgi:hypothetical protein